MFERCALNPWEFFEFLFRCLLHLYSVRGIVLDENRHLGHFDRLLFKRSEGAT